MVKQDLKQNYLFSQAKVGDKSNAVKGGFITYLHSIEVYTKDFSKSMCQREEVDFTP